LHGILKIESEEAVDKATNDVKFEAIGMNGDNIEVPEDDGNNVSSSSTSLDQLKSGDLPIFKKQKFQEQFGAIIPIIGHLRNAHLGKEIGEFLYCLLKKIILIFYSDYFYLITII